MIKRFFIQFFLGKRLYAALVAICLTFLASYWFTALFTLGVILLYTLGFFFLLDTVFLFRQGNGLVANRVLPERFSNSDANQVLISLENRYRFAVKVTLIDEVPAQFQMRDFEIFDQLEGKEKKEVFYSLTPLERGEYIFGDLHVFVLSRIGLVKRRFSFQKGQMVKVYPSFIQMQQFDFLATNIRRFDYGFKKIRRIGHTMEFEQIKNYIPGDDIRSINWKATAKSADLMVNQFQDEKSQPIYSILDMGRVMQMPFNGLSLLDYAINSCLAFSNVAIKKGDKAGVITFSHRMQKSMQASSRKSHLLGILEMLYGLDTDFLDTDFGLLYNWLKRKVSQRSMLLIFTNFEHQTALQRQLPYLKAIARQHLLVVVMFENTLLESLTEQVPDKISEVYKQTVAGKFMYDKRLMAKELNRHGIQTILTKPAELSINTINKYLELKARGLI
ncbi:DUF58 domain-containing protein [Belliella kenyensis]|uniref:DUF58 domain-containing protein n=1 Tax=Belliella kenyensis TaxID=1472724 RepID=A0ABV8EIW2_9BACT|nr:DUF58 domain-containing protein [Belliella kenyensis]MCH7402318.1 DUF58 domain-containing protein [Belliella kenyensis]MDN3603509.1 DUF58 domain-containing protein [Belliella kenyensis]